MSKQEIVIRERECALLSGQIRYRECGQGKPMLFLHGVPTSSYLWRHIMPSFACMGFHCVAPDLLGFGGSDYQGGRYSIVDHIDYLDALINAMAWSEPVLIVSHGWGSIIGFDYAYRHPDHIRGLAFYEAHLRPIVSQGMLSLPVQQVLALLNQAPDLEQAIVEHNIIINQLLPALTIEPLQAHDRQVYEASFAERSSRLPLLRYAMEFPTGDRQSPAYEIVQRYSPWLCQSDIPKCLLYAMPGFMTPVDTVLWAKDTMQSLQIRCINDALHLAQETSPDTFTRELMSWVVSHCLDRED